MRMPPQTQAALEQLLARMDQAYRQAAEVSGFVCRGCEQNCCYTLFYHHTLIEYLYLKIGMAELPAPVRKAAVRRAQATLAAEPAADEGAGSSAPMCPLNQQGRCILYAHRPMICRLHGIPHVLRRPDGKTHSGPGCDDFYRQCGAASPALLDRSPLYADMAGLERALRRQLGFQGRIKLTIARMMTNGIRDGAGGPPG